MRLELPKEAYKIGDKFYEVTDDNCYERSTSLKICSRPTSDKSVREHKEVACLAKTEKCEMQVTPCKTGTIFTVAGVLAFTESNIKGIEKVSSVEEFVEIERNNSKTQFYSWKNYKKLLIGNRLIVSMENPTFHIELEPTPAIAWESFLELTEVRLENINTSKLANTVKKQKLILDNIKGITKALHTEEWYSLIIEWSGVASLVLIIAAIMWKGLTKIREVITIYRNHNQLKKETVTHDIDGSQNCDSTTAIGWKSMPELARDSDKEDDQVWIRIGKKPENRKRGARKRAISLPPAKKTASRKPINNAYYEQLTRTENPALEIARPEREDLDVKEPSAPETEFNFIPREKPQSQQQRFQEEEDQRRSIQEWTNRLLEIARE